MKTLFLSLLLLGTALPFTHITAEELDTEIRVHLATSSPLQPIYIGKIKAKDAAFDAAYLACAS